MGIISSYGVIIALAIITDTFLDCLSFSYPYTLTAEMYLSYYFHFIHSTNSFAVISTCVHAVNDSLEDSETKGIPSPWTSNLSWPRSRTHWLDSRKSRPRIP